MSSNALQTFDFNDKAVRVIMRDGKAVMGGEGRVRRAWDSQPQRYNPQGFRKR